MSMNRTARRLAAFVALAAFSLAAVATSHLTDGEVRKVDKENGKLTLKHGVIKNLDMPAMTMVFRVQDDAILEKLKEGSNIEFVAERVNGKLTVTEVK